MVTGLLGYRVIGLPSYRVRVGVRVRIIVLLTITRLTRRAYYCNINSVDTLVHPYIRYISVFFSIRCTWSAQSLGR